ncbi:MAG TPA: NAD-dependent epimerase/dehydratase family protein [Solirubrobacteraceae bacterium]|nr:NAD-dependent epimerase/dehydratase family protein [Solirubrobacteraceae bacterium]
MKTLVTGGAGFIGTHLVRELVARGDEVVVLDSLEEQVHGGRQPDLPESVKLIVGHVGDAECADLALEGVDRVVHLAAAVGVGQSMYEIARYTERNTMQTALFLERVVARSPLPTRLVVASSMSIYGEGEYECAEHGRLAPAPRPEEQLLARQWELVCPTCSAKLTPVGTREDKALIPTSIYAITKRDHEELALVTGAAYGIPTVALRFFNVYGPGQALSNPYTGVAAIFASRLLNQREPIIFEDGEQSRDFIHVSDIVRGILLALESDAAAGHAVNLGTGRPSTVAQIAHALSAGMDADIEPIRREQYRAGDIRHCFADPTRARELLGFEALTTLEDGMRALLVWLADQEAEDHVEDATRELVARGLAV